MTKTLNSNRLYSLTIRISSSSDGERVYGANRLNGLQVKYAWDYAKKVFGRRTVKDALFLIYSDRSCLRIRMKDSQSTLYQKNGYRETRISFTDGDQGSSMLYCMLPV